MVQIMRSDNFVFDSLVVQLNGMLSIVASEDEQVLNSELVRFRPAYFEALLLLIVVLQRCLVQKIKDFFVVDLKERARD